MSPIPPLYPTPALFPEYMDPGTGRFAFCEMDHKCYRQSAFLDHRLSRLTGKRFIYPLSAIEASRTNLHEQPVHYVFHTAYCCSTLFSRTLEADKNILVLREPNILLEAATLFRYQGTGVLPPVKPSLANDLLDTVTSLLARRYRDTDTVIIKPSDACNILMDRLLARHADNRCILVYSRITQFIPAILKSKERIKWAGWRARELFRDASRQGLLGSVDPERLRPVEMITLVWVLHMRRLRDLLQGPHATRIRTMDAESFLQAPLTSVQSALAFFGSPQKTNDLVQHLDNVMHRHSKDPLLHFSHHQREQELAQFRHNYAKEITDGIRWATKTFGQDSLDDLTSPLVTLQ